MDGLTFYKFLRILKKNVTGSVLNRTAVINGRLNFSFYHKSLKGFYLQYKTTPPPSLEYTDTSAGESFGVLDQISGSVLADITWRAFDRLGFFHLEKRRPSGKIMPFTLVLEPMGNYANAFLLNGEGGVIYSLSSRNIDPDRDIGVGKSYIQPKANKKYNLRDIGAATGFEELTGFYPATVKMANIYKEQLGFTKACEKILGFIEESDLFYTDDAGKVFPFPPFGLNAETSSTSLSFDVNNGDCASQVIKKSLVKYYQKQYEHYCRLLKKIEQELLEVNDWQKLLDEANLVKDNLELIKTGSKVLKLYSEKGVEDVVYNYESNLTPIEYAQNLFKKSGKYKRSVPLVKKRIDEVRQMLESAGEQIYFIENSSQEELKELKELLNTKKQSKERSKNPDKDFHVYNLGEAVLYVGKNSASNHRLVFQFANASDLWLHAQNIPSAHGILRKDGRLTEDEILKAAAVIASYSKNKNEPKVSVDYTYKKYVKKPKNTPAGFVIYDRFLTVFVKPDIA